MRKSAFLFIALILARGQASLTSPTQRKAVLDFQLTLPLANRLLAAIPQMTKYQASQPDRKERIRKSATMTPAERLAAVENDPQAAAILKQNSLTAREYVIGYPTLQNAVYAAKFATQGTSSQDFPVSPANLAFAKANLAELYPKLRAAQGFRDQK